MDVTDQIEHSEGGAKRYWLAPIVADAEAGFGGPLNAFELMHVEGMRFLAETMPQVRLPAPMGTDWAVLAEVSDGAGSEVAARFTGLLADALEAGIAEDGLLAQSEAQRQSFWRVRESIPEANRHVGSISSHDVSVPPSRIAEFIARGPAAIAALDPSLRINCFGHLGDGNLHYNVFPPRGRHRDEFDSLRGAVKAAIHDLVHELGGSVGAEHGVGRLKVEDLERYGDPAKLAAMRRIKAALDPLGILNPGAVISGG